MNLQGYKNLHSFLNVFETGFNNCRKVFSQQEVLPVRASQPLHRHRDFKWNKCEALDSKAPCTRSLESMIPGSFFTRIESLIACRWSRVQRNLHAHEPCGSDWIRCSTPPTPVGGAVTVAQTTEESWKEDSTAEEEGDESSDGKFGSF